MRLHTGVLLSTSVKSLHRHSLCHASDGSVMRPTPHGDLPGRCLDVASGPAMLPNPQQWRMVELWQGRRVVLLAYAIRDDRLSDADRTALTDLGFNFQRRIPSVQPRDVRVSNVQAACRSVQGSQPSVVPLPKGPEQMIFVEICCGTAVLSKAAAKVGFRIFPVDCDRRRAPPQKHCLLRPCKPRPAASHQRPLVRRKG